MSALSEEIRIKHRIRTVPVTDKEYWYLVGVLQTLQRKRLGFIVELLNGGVRIGWLNPKNNETMYI